MVRPIPALFGLVGVAAYWYGALRLLYWAFPVFVDGAGMEVSFFWGTREPSAYPEFGYAYLAAASILTFLGCTTVWLMRLRPGGWLQVFLVGCSAAFIVYCFAVAVSDAGTKYHIWSGPTAFGWGGPTGHGRAQFYRPLLAVIVPLSFMAGLLALGRRRLADRTALQRKVGRTE